MGEVSPTRLLLFVLSPQTIERMDYYFVHCPDMDLELLQFPPPFEIGLELDDPLGRLCK